MSKSFLVCLALSVIDALARFLSSYINDGECVKRLGGMLVSGGTNVMFIASIFTALYLGTEYSNGTLRNKLVIGHTRTAVYFANLTTVLSGTFACAAAEWLVTAAAGLITGGSLGMSADEFAMCAAVYICALAALCAVNTLIGMLIAAKSSTVVVTLVLMLGTMIISSTLIQLLSIPKNTESYELTDTGMVQIVISDKENPMYIGGAKRLVFTFVNNVLPCGPACWLEGGKLPENGEALPLFSLSVTAVSTAAGAVVFRRKDLK